MVCIVQGYVFNNIALGDTTYTAVLSGQSPDGVFMAV